MGADSGQMTSNPERIGLPLVDEVDMAFSPEVSALSIGPRTIQKLRIRILPLVFLLYVIAY